MTRPGRRTGTGGGGRSRHDGVVMAVLDHPVTRRVRASTRLLGPAFVAAIAYVDPGNVATNVAAGATHGYLLVWVVVVANLTACVVQYLSAKVGLVTGLSLPEALRHRMPKSGRLLYWGQAELVAMATDLAEVVGGAIALNILFDLPLLLGAVITAVVSTALLTVQNRRGQRPSSTSSPVCWRSSRSVSLPGSLSRRPRCGHPGWFASAFDGRDSVLLAAAMLGATVMPHAVYLHSVPGPGSARQGRREPAAVTAGDHPVRRRCGDAGGGRRQSRDAAARGNLVAGQGRRRISSECP